MRIRTLVFGIITVTSVLSAVAMTATANAAPVSGGSDPHQICSVYTNGTIDECLNNWGHAYGYVESYAPNAANNNFVVEGVDRCGNGDYTTSGCPVSGVPAGLFIYQIAYGDELSDCIANLGGNSPYAADGLCNGSNGYGGSDGTLEIAYYGSCPSGTNLAINVYWTGQSGGWSQTRGIWWQQGNGSVVSLDVGDGGTPLPCLGYYSY